MLLHNLLLLLLLLLVWTTWAGTANDNLLLLFLLLLLKLHVLDALLLGYWLHRLATANTAWLELATTCG